MKAEEALRRALREGSVVRGEDVNACTYPTAARTYLADATGIAWTVPHELAGAADFVVDAEIVAPVRSSLQRYGITDPTEFAEAWTRAEVWAKLFDLPIITWLSRYGLSEPDVVRQAHRDGSIAWTTRVERDTVITFGARNSGLVGGGV